MEGRWGVFSIAFAIMLFASGMLTDILAALLIAVLSFILIFLGCYVAKRADWSSFKKASIIAFIVEGIIGNMGSSFSFFILIPPTLTVISYRYLIENPDGKPGKCKSFLIISLIISLLFLLLSAVLLMQQDENISLFVMEFSRLGLISLFTVISDLLLLRLYSSRRDGIKYGIAVGVMFFVIIRS